jgi:hypothetical protein
MFVAIGNNESNFFVQLCNSDIHFRGNAIPNALIQLQNKVSPY